MSKGWGRRPQSVDRAQYDAAYEATFSENGAVVEENDIAPPAGDTEPEVFSVPLALNPRKRPSLDPFDIAEIMEPEGTDWRRA